MALSRQGLFPAAPPPTIQFTYQERGVGTEKVFSVPPLNATALISTPRATGIADQAALTVVPTNEALCNRQPTTLRTPASFDFREEFVDFTAPIVDQGTCGACWAIASTQAFASRTAFFTNQRVAPLSAAYLLYCVRGGSFSAKAELEYGCFGGTLVNAHWFFLLEGTVAASCLKYDHLGTWDPSNPDLVTRIVPGADGKTSSVTCPMLTCPPPDDAASASTPAAAGPQQPWLYKMSMAYIVAGTRAQSGASEENIRQEIWRKGPVTTGFEVRQDFLLFWQQLLESKLAGAAQVYRQARGAAAMGGDAANPLVGNHAVQLVGWGEVDGVKYWIVANSWGATNRGTAPADLADYGHNGYFLMERGTNAYALESNVVTGLPAVHPATVNAVGQPAYSQEVDMCDLIAYEVNRSLFEKLKLEVPLPLPDPPNMYEFTLPPLDPAATARIRRFPRCPPDRTYRCDFTGTCVTSPLECGTAIPSQGAVQPVQQLLTKPNLAASREIAFKYLAEDAFQRKSRVSADQSGKQQQAAGWSVAALVLFSLALCATLALLVLLLNQQKT
jgi:cathepsin B